MKAAVLTDKCKMEIWNVDIPDITDTQVLIRQKACAICNSTDTKLYMGEHGLVRYPCIIGHEGAGVVESVGSKVTSVKPGDKVLGGSYPSTGELASLWGQYCEYGIAEEKDIIHIPLGVGLNQACCAHMLGEAVNALRVGDIRPGDNILIIGAGAVGLSLLTVMKNSFPRAVIVLDIDERRLDLALQLGADFVFNAEDPELVGKVVHATEGTGVNKLYEAVGSNKTYNLAFDIIQYGGYIMAFGIEERGMKIPFRKLYDKEAQIRWCHAAGVKGKENKEIVLNMMSKGLIDVNSLITGTVNLENICTGFNRISSGNEIRVIVEM